MKMHLLLLSIEDGRSLIGTFIEVGLSEASPICFP